ncbi:inactive serine protease 54 isoform B [Alligator mississippiensis]|uniref:Inactive serine protease 54 isoform B n=1 Tax=Alligator mississippiensis TaxID=8496 RepID=A0A151MSK4_ALLMI|nr:inactive serine protease 54 isoform B [Alligator mississippiensis]
MKVHPTMKCYKQEIKSPVEHSSTGCYSHSLEFGEFHQPPFCLRFLQFLLKDKGISLKLYDMDASVGGLLTLFVYITIALKLVSYYQVNHWYREGNSRPTKGTARIQAESSSYRSRKNERGQTKQILYTVNLKVKGISLSSHAGANPAGNRVHLARRIHCKTSDWQFYFDWWNADSLLQFWSRWNIPAHKWLDRHIYRPLLQHGYDKWQARMTMFLLSACFYKVPLACIMKRLFGGNAGSQAANNIKQLHGRRTGCLVLLFLCFSYSLVAGCGTQISLAPSSTAQEFVAVGEFPWVVSLQDLQHKHLAFGCILSEYWILSAASRLQNRHPALAMVGMTDLNMQQKVQLRYSIKTIIPYEDFDEITRYNNIALLKTATPVQFSDTVQPICFPGRNLTASALENCWVSGWLYAKQAGNRAAVSFLRKLSVLDVDPCPLKRIITTECCSHRESDNVTGCLGDSGNPVMCQPKGTKRWVLSGVLSEGGMRCYGPFLYTKLSYYSDWISATTKKAGTTIYHTFARGHAASPAPTEYLQGSNYSQGKQQQKGSKSSQVGLDRSKSKSAPLYYDYYSGEVLPIPDGSCCLPYPTQDTIAIFLLLCLLFY